MIARPWSKGCGRPHAGNGRRRIRVCLNTPKLGTGFLRETIAAEAPELGFIERVANPEAFADVSEERALKVLVYRQPQ